MSTNLGLICSNSIEHQFTSDKMMDFLISQCLIFPTMNVYI